MWNRRASLNPEIIIYFIPERRYGRRLYDDMSSAIMMTCLRLCMMICLRLCMMTCLRLCMMTCLRLCFKACSSDLDCISSVNYGQNIILR